MPRWKYFCDAIALNIYLCAYPLAKDYFEKLNAPTKGFYMFENSAHSPMFEEPEKMQKIFLEDVLAGTNNLADGK